MDDWRTLNVGDRIRFVRMPPEWDAPDCFVHASTRRVFRKLLARRRPVRIAKIDAWGVPWFACRFRQANGGWELHDIGITESGWVRVPAGQGARGAGEGNR